MKKSHKILLGIGGILIIFAIVAFTSPGVDRHQDSRKISASQEEAWKVISDVGNYHKYATGLTGVTIISGQGEGMVRSCSDELGSWEETCTAWNEGSSYSFNVDVGSGFPYPLRKMNGTWSVKQIDENYSELLIEFEYQFQYRWMSWMFTNATHEAFKKGDKVLIDNWEKEIVAADAEKSLGSNTN